MRITWITRSFLDYRIPVFDELNRLTGGKLVLIYYKDVVPERVGRKARQVLGANSVGMEGEIRLVGPRSFRQGGSGSGLRIPYQPGLVSAIWGSKPDVMVTDGFFQWTAAALWLRALRKTPHVMLYERTGHTDRNVSWFRIEYRKRVMRWIDMICCSGSLCGAYTAGLGYPAERLTFSHMAADIEGLSKAAAAVRNCEIKALKAQHELRGLVFLFVGGLIKRKGVDRLLGAWRLFSRETGRDKATLLLVGEGPQQKELKEWCLKNKLANVRFAGPVDYDSIAPYYRCADVFTIPTLSDNWSLVTPEAMACGLPVMCSLYNGCYPELVQPENGWVFDPLKEQSALGALREIYRNRNRLPEMGEMSKRIVHGGHSPKIAAGRIYESCKRANEIMGGPVDSGKGNNKKTASAGAAGEMLQAACFQTEVRPMDRFQVARLDE